jgi:hypothetical protein
MTKAQFLKYQEKLIALQNEIENSAGKSDVYTFVFLSCRGRANTL